MSDNKAIIEEFRAHAGKVGGAFAGATLLLLTTTGAKTGLSRTNPLMYFVDNDRYLVVASYAGAPRNPPWYYNLISNPTVGVEIGIEQFTARAEALLRRLQRQLHPLRTLRRPLKDRCRRDELDACIY